MTVLQILKIIAAVATIATGLLSLFRPLSTQSFTGLTVAGPRGVTEVRSILGGLFIALGLVPLLLGKAAPQTYTMLGVSYLAIGLVRVISIFVDKSSVQSNWISLAVEIVLGVILVIP
jgi:hypothetical protein